MKRYDLPIYYDPDGEGLILTEKPDGLYYLVSDVSASMIPRPDPEEARKAVDEYGDAVEHETQIAIANKQTIHTEESLRLFLEAEKRSDKAEKVLLRLMGVEDV